MGKSCNSSESPCPSSESERDVCEDYEEGDYHGDDCIPCDVVCDGRTHFVRADDTVRVVLGRSEFIQGDSVGKEAFQSVVEDVFNLNVNVCRFLLNLVGSGNLHLALASELLDFGSRIVNALVICRSIVECVVYCCADCLSVNRLVEPYHICTSSCEVDTV